MGPALRFEVSASGGYALLLPLSLLFLLFLLLYIVQRTVKKKTAYDEQIAKVTETIELAKRKLARVKREITAPQEAFEPLRHAERLLSLAEFEAEHQKNLELAIEFANRAGDRMFDAMALNNNYRQRSERMKQEILDRIDEATKKDGQ